MSPANLKGGIVEESSSGENIDAELLSLQHVDVDEIIILTGGLRARSLDDKHVQFYPVWREEEPMWGGGISCDTFQTFLIDHSIDIIGIKQVAKTDNATHWRWAPATACHSPPHNNPSYRWKFISSGIRRSATSGTRLNFIGERSNEAIPETDTKSLAALARHIAIDLHQLNHAIVMMAEHLHNELLSQGPRCRRNSHIRHLDLSAHVHSFYQAFSAARDHYAQFLAIQMGQKKVEGEEIDSMFKLLNAVEPSQLRQLKIIKLLEDKAYLEIGGGIRKHKGKCRLVYKPDTWLIHANKLRNRFAHGAPYGTLSEEDVTEVYRPCDISSIFLAKSFLEKGEGEFPPDILRTINHSYQGICGLFLLAADATGYEGNPPLVSLLA